MRRSSKIRAVHFGYTNGAPQRPHRLRMRCIGERPVLKTSCYIYMRAIPFFTASRFLPKWSLARVPKRIMSAVGGVVLFINLRVCLFVNRIRVSGGLASRIRSTYRAGYRLVLGRRPGLRQRGWSWFTCC